MLRSKCNLCISVSVSCLVPLSGRTASHPVAPRPVLGAGQPPLRVVRPRRRRPRLHSCHPHLLLHQRVLWNSRVRNHIFGLNHHAMNFGGEPDYQKCAKFDLQNLKTVTLKTLPIKLKLIQS